MATITQPSSNLGVSRSVISAQFREIHKNTWLKKLNADGKKITVGPKKSERSWVVFCVHDDTEAILEGYAEPRQAASHNPEWVVKMQNTLHISHSLIPNSNEFEFVVTLSNEVIRFHAMSWEIMQEWVETLRSKLREMKILSPRENLYTKLPEIRPPLLPTRDPTSPLPLPPPVPAAIVPGVEIIVPLHNIQQQQLTTSALSQLPTNDNVPRTTAIAFTSTTMSPAAVSATNDTSTTSQLNNNTPVMSNTSTQNLLNMLSDPISSYSEQLLGAVANSSSSSRLNTEQLSTSLNDLRLNHSFLNNEDEDCLSPLLRPGASSTHAEIQKRNSADQPKNAALQCERLIPRPQTSRSQSAGAVDKTKQAKKGVNKSLTTNVTALEIKTSPDVSQCIDEKKTFDEENSQSNITIIQVSDAASADVQTQAEDTSKPTLPARSSTTAIAAEIFTFPEAYENNDVTINKTHKTALNLVTSKHSEYKSNVQLIPSNSNMNSSTIKIVGESQPTTSNFMAAATPNQYSTPIKKQTQTQISTTTTTKTSATTASTTKPDNNRVTTVHVGGGTSIYGTCFQLQTEQDQSATVLTPKLPKKIILSANTSGITNIKVDNHTNRTHAISQDNTSSIRCNVGSLHYEKVFLSTSTPIVNGSNAIVGENVITTTTTTATATSNKMTKNNGSTALNGLNIEQASNSATQVANNAQSEQSSNDTTTPIASTSNQAANKRISKAVQTTTTTQKSPKNDELTNKNTTFVRSPLVQRRAVALRSTNLLTRGLTEAVITTRPSRRDLFAGNSASSSTPKTHNTKLPAGIRPLATKSIVNNNENGETTNSLTDVLEQRRRSSSTSDATTTTATRAQQRPTRGSNNNELLSSSRLNAALRFQQPPQPYRNIENGLLGPVGLIVAAGMSPPPVAAASASKRLTLREQQVMQLRREIMHPGGVRLQLRRKDCIGSIAWVEAFGAVWVAGWKQKEHPVLYNALHIGDQLLSIAGVSISSAAEANKIIRTTNTLFVELLIRRIPFGCGIAIRRDREGQCLGLIRDGNTATIVDVVPNSLAARHGLPPKTQACDGSSLTFWVLTEINGRPLNLFFKDNEIRDRLNSVGRDISILVQPSDLITKLKKQLKSLRSYKDYLVQ